MVYPESLLELLPSSKCSFWDILPYVLTGQTGGGKASHGKVLELKLLTPTVTSRPGIVLLC